MLLTTSYVNSTFWLGGDSNFDTYQIGGYHPFSWGRNTLSLIYVAATVNNELPNEVGIFSLGGFTNMTAYRPGQLSGNHGGTLGLMSTYHLHVLKDLSGNSLFSENLPERNYSSYTH